jgi:hypothetical protein
MEGDFCVGNNKSAVVHGMARYAMSTACTQHVGHGETLSSPASFKRHTQAGGIIFDRLYLSAVLNADA